MLTTILLIVLILLLTGRASPGPHRPHSAAPGVGREADARVSVRALTAFGHGL